MAKSVERLRYFDGEYLRSYDFTDEQSYHIEMRRLLNRKLHLYGIVYGLRIVQDADSVSGGPYFFSIEAGMAIDQIGREILVPAPYSLTGVLDGPDIHSGPYEVWICYQETDTGLPADGYAGCVGDNQNTRLLETFQIQLRPLTGPSLFTDCGGVRLGVVNVANVGPLGPSIVPPANNVERAYVGIRAQRIIAPDPEPDGFAMTGPPAGAPNDRLPGYLDVHPSVFERGNLIVKKNAVIGDDFVLTPGSGGVPGTIPATGNLKITNDLFLNGDFYGLINGNWLELKQYIQSQMPDIQVGTADINLAGVTTPSGTQIVSITTKLPSVSGAPTVLLSIIETDWRDQKALVGQGAVTVTVTNGTPTLVSGKNWSFPINYTVSPAVTLSGGLTGLPLTGLQVSYLVIFMP